MWREAEILDYTGLTGQWVSRKESDKGASMSWKGMSDSRVEGSKPKTGSTNRNSKAPKGINRSPGESKSFAGPEWPKSMNWKGNKDCR